MLGKKEEASVLRGRSHINVVLKVTWLMCLVPNSLENVNLLNIVYFSNYFFFFTSDVRLDSDARNSLIISNH
jgi:hypothetical protein